MGSELIFCKALCTAKHENLFRGLFVSTALTTRYFGLSFFTDGKDGKNSVVTDFAFFLFRWGLGDNRENLLFPSGGPSRDISLYTPKNKTKSAESKSHEIVGKCELVK